MSKGPLICWREATHNSLQLMADFSTSQSALESRIVVGGGEVLVMGVVVVLRKELSSWWKSLLACLSFSMDTLESQEGLIENLLLIFSIFLTQKQEQGAAPSMQNACIQCAGEGVQEPIHRCRIGFVRGTAACVGVR